VTYSEIKAKVLDLLDKGYTFPQIEETLVKNYPEDKVHIKLVIITSKVLGDTHE